MALISWTEPRTLLACVHVTRRVLGDSKVVRSAGESRGLVDLAWGVHHFSARFRRLARSFQGAMLASWSIEEMMISSPGWKGNVYDRLRRSCVAEGPKAGGG